MSYGFQAWNSSGFAQIDGSLPQMMQVASGTATVANYSNLVYGNGSLKQVISIPTAYNNEDIFVFIKPNTTSGTWAVGVWKYKDGGQWKIWFWSSQNWGTQTVKYAVFIGQSTVATNTGYGMNIFNANGKVGFSTNRVNVRGLQASMGVLNQNSSIGPLTHGSINNVYALYTGTNFVERDFTGDTSYDPNQGSMQEEGLSIHWYHSEIVFNYGGKTITMRAQEYYNTYFVFVGYDKGGSSTRTLVTGMVV
jgi:hypothetical protein